MFERELAGLESRDKALQNAIAVVDALRAQYQAYEDNLREGLLQLIYDGESTADWPDWAKTLITAL
jgi:hypothetical protein